MLCTHERNDGFRGGTMRHHLYFYFTWASWWRCKAHKVQVWSCLKSLSLRNLKDGHDIKLEAYYSRESWSVCCFAGKSTCPTADAATTASLTSPMWFFSHKFVNMISCFSKEFGAESIRLLCHVDAKDLMSSTPRRYHVSLLIIAKASALIFKLRPFKGLTKWYLDMMEIRVY
jgi:hypothetical protein